MSKAYGKGSDRRKENFRRIQDNWSDINWSSKEVCIKCLKEKDKKFLSEELDLFGKTYYICSDRCR